MNAPEACSTNRLPPIMRQPLVLFWHQAIQCQNLNP